MKENNPHILGTEKVGKLLLEYSIPAIIGMTLTSLYNIIDSVFIGHGVGAMAISGLAISFPLMNLLVAFCTLVGVGGATISSIRLGQKDTDGAEKVLGNVTVLCVINSISTEASPCCFWTGFCSSSGQAMTRCHTPATLCRLY